jgi:hypothetical protein
LQRCKAVLDGLIVQMAKPVVTSPVHSLRLCRKVIEHAETASKYFSNLLPFEDEPVARSRLPRGIGQAVAVPTAPEVATRSIELSDPSATVTQKVSSSSAKVPPHPSDREYLIVERDSIVVPVPWLNASRVKFISVNRPISRNVADITRSAQLINVNASRLFYGLLTVSATTPHLLTLPILSKSIGFFRPFFGRYGRYRSR